MHDSRGERVKLARRILGLTRKEFDQRSEISANTLQAWESDKITLTEKGAQRLVVALSKLGLLCTKEWFLAGQGQPPTFIENLDQNSGLNEAICIQREIEIFKALNPNAIVIIVPDNGMEPLYDIGSFVGGYKKSDNHINKLINHCCIVETVSGMTFLRKILKGSRNNLYNLACININSDQQPLISDVQLKTAAKVILHRTRDII